MVYRSDKILILRGEYMPRDMMNTKEVARYLGINPKRVYALAKGRSMPGTRVAGKWVFPKWLIDEWIETSARANLDPDAKRQKTIDKLVLCDRQP